MAEVKKTEKSEAPKKPEDKKDSSAKQPPSASNAKDLDKPNPVKAAVSDANMTAPTIY